MTKETKIGLLVGLAFIILFAIILSEKGPVHKGASAPVFSVVDAGGKTAPTTTPNQPLREAGKLPVDSQLAPIVHAGQKPLPVAPVKMQEEEVSQAPIETEPAEKLPDTLASLIKKQPERFAAAKSEPPQVDIAKQNGPIRSEPSKPDTILARIPEPKSSGDRGSSIDTFDDDQAPNKTDSEKKKEPPVAIKTEHVVQPGESLGKIAAKYYGRSTPARVDAIYKSNRDTLASVSAVRAGNKLRIPDLGEFNVKFEPAPGFLTNPNDPGKDSKPGKDAAVRIPVPVSETATARANDKPAKPEKKSVTVAASKSEPGRDSKYDVYEVRKGDTLSKICRRELGNEKFARELYKLNKDKLTDRNNLKPGTKLRMPSRAALGAEPAAALSSLAVENAEP